MHIIVRQFHLVFEVYVYWLIEIAYLLDEGISHAGCFGYLEGSPSKTIQILESIFYSYEG